MNSEGSEIGGFLSKKPAGAIAHGFEDGGFGYVTKIVSNSLKNACYVLANGFPITLEIVGEDLR